MEPAGFMGAPLRGARSAQGLLEAAAERPCGFGCLCACVSVSGRIQGWRRHQARCQLEVPLSAPSSSLLLPTQVRNKHYCVPGALAKSFPPPRSQAFDFTALNVTGGKGNEF